MVVQAIAAENPGTCIFNCSHPVELLTISFLNLFKTQHVRKMKLKIDVLFLKHGSLLH